MRPPRRQALLLLAALGCRAEAPGSRLRIPEDCGQLLLVRAAGWEATEGWLRRLERGGADSTWRSAGEPSPVTLGRSGLAWAEEAARPGAPRKREGDGRSPAGIFPLGIAFGAEPLSAVKWIRLPYLRLEPGTECVDDPSSRAYNTIAAASAPRDWKSSERMLDVGAPYRLGVFVGHNVAPARPGLGSCIFLHLWGEKPAPTSGCTAMGRETLEEVLRWLDPGASPQILQLPEAEYAKARRALGLPE